MSHFYRSIFVGLCLCLLGNTMLAAPIKVDSKISPYQKITFVTGTLNSIGSDTLNNLMTLWSEAFRKVYPNVVIQVEGKGSSTAPPALIKNTAQLGPMSRKMKNKETDAFEKANGFAPTPIGVALDSLALYVHKDNPLSKLSLQQVDAIFSKNRKGGHPKAIKTWGDAGLKGPWANRPLSLYGRNSASGTYGYFKSNALFKGDYQNSVKEQPGSASVVLSITEDMEGIGYSGIGYRTSGVKTLALAKKPKQPAYLPTYKNVLSQKYPLGRMLYIYIAKKPNTELSPLIKEFLTFVLSREGQEIVIKDGYLPLPSSVANKQKGQL